MTRDRDEILQELKGAETRLAELERAREEARTRVLSLRSELEGASRSAPGSAAVRQPVGTSGELPRTPEEKIKLFRSLFRGRPDVFPTRFVSKKTNRAGYAPACSNKWEPGLCALLAGGKCGDCPNQAFVPVEKARKNKPANQSEGRV